MTSSFELTGRVAVVSGGYGVLGGALAGGLAAAGARVAILGRRREPATAFAGRLHEQGAEAMGLVADVLDERQLAAARDELLAAWGRVDILVNAAGGNVARARNDTSSIFDVPRDAFDEVVRLNLDGTVLPSLAFGAAMARQRAGSIINISSMAAGQALSGVLGYSVAKAAVDNFTRWMAVELARKHGDGLRVNAIAPGFFIAEQNRAVLVDAQGEYTERARTIVAHTPMGRFGRPEELIGAVRWLASDAASFVTGVVIPIDGGFSAFSGV
ncbi:MAG TPA: SDR family oxidoreductase [Gemmatimonadaceae bacterium]|nr:SDR family oxidoreductase [Gemmatimonadaceae bacterium]